MFEIRHLITILLFEQEIGLVCHELNKYLHVVYIYQYKDFYIIFLDAKIAKAVSRTSHETKTPAWKHSCPSALPSFPLFHHTFLSFPFSLASPFRPFLFSSLHSFISIFSFLSSSLSFNLFAQKIHHLIRRRKGRQWKTKIKKHWQD